MKCASGNEMTCYTNKYPLVDGVEYAAIVLAEGSNLNALKKQISCIIEDFGEKAVTYPHDVHDGLFVALVIFDVVREQVPKLFETAIKHGAALMQIGIRTSNLVSVGNNTFRVKKKDIN